MLTEKRFAAARPLPPDRRPQWAHSVRAVGSFVPKLTAKVFERYGFHSAEIMTAWPRVAGDDIAAISAPERIRWPRGTGMSEDGTVAGGAATLVLRVEPAHALDVEYKSAEIVDRINRYFGYRAIAEIKILQVPLDARGQRGPGPNITAVPCSEMAGPRASVEPDVDQALARLGASILSKRQR